MYLESSAQPVSAYGFGARTSACIVKRSGELAVDNEHIFHDYVVPRPSQQLRFDARLPSPTYAPVFPGSVTGYTRDVYRDGSPSDVLDNGLVRLVVSPQAGGRMFSFVDDETGDNAFTTVGALRDDVAIEPPLSTVDTIAKYTHDMPAGTFNRPYDAHIVPTADGTASVELRYDAPDVVPSGATYDKRMTLAAGARSFDVAETFDLDASSTDSAQHGVSVSSLAVDCSTTTTDCVRLLSPEIAAFAPDTTIHITDGHALGLYSESTHRFATIAWRAGDIDDATVLEKRYSVLVRLTLARGKTAHMRYGYEMPATTDEARRLLAKADAAAQHASPQVTSTPARTP